MGQFTHLLTKISFNIRTTGLLPIILKTRGSLSLPGWGFFNSGRYFPTLPRPYLYMKIKKYYGLKICFVQDGVGLSSQIEKELGIFGIFAMLNYNR